ncbi:MAG: hypothetical protein KBG15_14715 [Kofleriaceae bacterium]|nr:hypothetical protein [Kofleriaceae bacterium]
MRSMLLVVSVSIVAVQPAGAWEAQTTQVGLAEQAALASVLHARLVALGLKDGLFELLTVPPADAHDLLAALARLSPSHGTTPDLRGRQTALSWIAAGAAVADAPAEFAVNHFFDPFLAAAGKAAGYRQPSRDFIGDVGAAVRRQMGRVRLPIAGVAAPDWLNDKRNPFNVDAFYQQYSKAITSASPGQRARHMAAALTALGVTLHVLGDMGTPSHVRSDVMLDYLGADPNDYGSRFERIAALAFGRLGIPTPTGVTSRTSVRGFFTNAEGTGLADVTARSYFSSGTLPRASKSESDVPASALIRPAPSLPTRLNLMTASGADGTLLRNAAGVCLARYRVSQGVLSFFTDDECQLEQIGALLPTVVSYQAGLTDFLFRGQLVVTVEGADLVVRSPAALGAGVLTIVSEDAQGVRTAAAGLPSVPLAAGADVGRMPVPTGVAWYAVWNGLDGNGQPVVAVGRVKPASEPPRAPAPAQ